MRIINRFLPFIIFLFLFSCEQTPTGIIETPTNVQEKKEDSPFIAGNKKIVMLENEEIELFLKRYQWDMTQTGSGLRIEITEEGKGDYPQKNELVTLSYKTFLLSGNPVYNSEEDRNNTFKVHKTEQLIGLHEAVLMMKKGSSARVILPSHLAYGLAGDGKKILGAKPVVMLITLLEQNEPATPQKPNVNF